MHKDTVQIGLTGGIGSGKSTVAGMLQKLGATIVDADAISREMTGPGGCASVQIEATFGSTAINHEGALDRERMREIIFQDSAARAKLESILHPLIRQRMLADADHAISLGSECIVFDVPLLVESKAWRGLMDKIVVVDCSVETQQVRVMQRSSLSMTMIQRVIASQASRGLRLRGADVVVFNDGISLSQLSQQVQAIAVKIGL